MGQIKAPDGYEIVDREKEPDAIVGNDWLVAAIDKGRWTDSAYIGDPMRETDRGCTYARPIRKRTLWVPASERQPPVDVEVLTRNPHDGGYLRFWARSHGEKWSHIGLKWLDLDAVESIEAERDRLAAQCAEHAARIAELEREVADLNAAKNEVTLRIVVDGGKVGVHRMQ